MLPVSVIICTHNPRADYLSDTLAGLAAQTLAHDAWELLLVDNASDEPMEGRFNLGWHADARVVREETLGLTPARLRGVAEARGELLLFVDDDNVLNPDYLEQALLIANERPWLGAWSGQCGGRFEQPPPEWTRRYWGNLVIREFDKDHWSNLPRLAATMPCGAGLCVRREVGRHYLELHKTGSRSIQLDRTGDSLLSGGDNDLAACACDLGLGVGLIAALKLQHLIAPGRFTPEYLSRLAYGIHYSSVLLDAERGIRRPAQGLLTDVANWLRRLRLRGPHRGIAKAAQDGEKAALRALSAPH